MDIAANIDFKIIKEFDSEGANSELYLVEDKQMGIELILKKISKKPLKNPERYFEEAKKICKAKHPNIIDIRHVSYDDENIYITMPYYENGSLQRLLETRNLMIEEVINYSLQFLSAIEYVHNIGILHCDIKPTNILLSKDNRAVLTDFGSSVYLNKNGKAKLRNVYYKHIAPEQCSNTTINTKVDIYQIGTTLYRMCNGDLEYNKQLKRYKNIEMVKVASASGKFPNRDKYLPHIPQKMIDIIEKCLSLKPEHRYESVSEIIEEIKNIKENLHWRYEKKGKQHYFTKSSSDKLVTQILLSKKDNFWSIKTMRVNKDNKTYTLYKGYCMDYLESKKDGFKEIKKIIALLSYRSK
ncbi:MAG: serine/threonine-protein kinase [Paraclostridium sp.]